MRISCPFCGDRDVSEFIIRGEVATARPTAQSIGAMTDYVHSRANPSGVTREYWLHAAGCRQWLIVTRNTRTHAVHDVAYAAQEDAP